MFIGQDALLYEITEIINEIRSLSLAIRMYFLQRQGKRKRFQ